MTEARKNLILDTFAYIGVLMATYFILDLVLGLGHTNILLPYAYNWDQFAGASLVKGLIDTGWYLTNPSLGAPGSLDMSDFAVGADNGNFLILKILAVGVKDPFVLVNVFYLLTFLLTAVTAVYSLRRIGISRLPAVVVALLFAFMPYHFFRFEYHLMLSAYWAIPLAFVLIVNICDEGVPSGSPTKSGISWARFAESGIIVVILGSSGIYYAFFSAFLLVILGCYLFVNGRQWDLIGRVAIAVLLLTLVVLINMSPTIWNTFENGKNHEAGGRNYQEAENYGLRISHLVLPVPNHRITAVDRVRGAYRDLMPGELPGGAALGVIGTVGFFLALFAAFRSRKYFETNPRQRPLGTNGQAPGISVQEVVPFLLIGCLLLATTNSFGSIIAFVAFPQIRAYNRISIVIAFIALISVASLLNWVLLWTKHQLTLLPILNSRFKRWLSEGCALFLAGLIVFLGVSDQTTKAFLIDQSTIEGQYSADADFVHMIESQLPNQAMVFQLPYVPFPENPPIQQMADYDHMRLYLHSTKIHWSYAAMKGRAEDSWQRKVTALGTKKMVDTMVGGGFLGITVTRYGYQDNADALIAGLKEILGAEPQFDADGKRAFFSLLNYRDAVVKTGEMEAFRAESAQILAVASGEYEIGQVILKDDVAYFGTGWSQAEPSHRWSEGTVAELNLRLRGSLKKQQTYQLTIGLAATMGKQTVSASINGQELGQLQVEGGTSFSFPLPGSFLQIERPNKIRLELPRARLAGNGDPRVLALAFRSMRIE